MKDDIKDFLSSKGVEWEEVSDLRVSRAPQRAAPNAPGQGALQHLPHHARFGPRVGRPSKEPLPWTRLLPHCLCGSPLPLRLCGSSPTLLLVWHGAGGGL